MTDSDQTHPRAQRIATSVKEQLDKQSSSRRTFLNRSGLAGGVLLGLGGSTGFVLAQDSDDEAETDEEPVEMAATFNDIEGTDIDVLNYALTLEHLENAFYSEGMEMFDENDFMEAESMQSMNEEMRTAVYEYLGTIGEHESLHVEVLTQAVELLGGEPAMEATYNFGVESVDDFLALAQVLENTGVAAYAGAGPYIESPDLQSAALAIHSVEARHAALLNWINGESPFPNAFDPALSQDEVLDAVSDFIEMEGGDGTDTSDTSNGSGNDSTATTPTASGNGNGNTTTVTPTTSSDGNESG